MTEGWLCAAMSCCIYLVTFCWGNPYLPSKGGLMCSMTPMRRLHPEGGISSEYCKEQEGSDKDMGCQEPVGKGN